MQILNISIVPEGYPQTIRFSQDDIGREFQINVTDFTIPNGATVKIQATKPSGLGFSVAGTVSGNSVTFTTTETMTNESGRFPAELVITSGAVVIGTANFNIYSEQNPHPDGTTDGDTGSIVPYLTQLKEDIENSNAKIESLTVSATRLSPGATPTAAYDPDTNTLNLGIPSTIYTDPNGDGNVVLS